MIVSSPQHAKKFLKNNILFQSLDSLSLTGFIMYENNPQRNSGKNQSSQMKDTIPGNRKLFCNLIQELFSFGNEKLDNSFLSHE